MSEIEIIQFVGIRILYAIGCGAIVGIERELNHAQAGFKTQILICVGAMLFSSIPEISMTPPHANETARIIGQIVSGVGFLGAGAIFYSAGSKVIGLTTAAWVWFTAAVGVMIGVGHGPSALFTTAAVAITITVARKVERGFIWRTRKTDHPHHLTQHDKDLKAVKDKKSA